MRSATTRRSTNSGRRVKGLDIGDDLFSIGEVRRADRLPQHQGGNAGQSRQSADDAPDTTGSTGV